MCYNTLCDKYATPQAYGYTPSWALAWEYRKELLLQDILNYSADIVCLQVTFIVFLFLCAAYYFVCIIFIHMLTESIPALIFCRRWR
jgi:hypothetical protein